MGLSGEPAERRVLVPMDRLDRWCVNFGERHGESTVSIEGGALLLRAEDGSWARLSAPFARALTGDATVERLRRASTPPASWGVLLVRKGGFAVAAMRAADMTAHKVGSRHVQGRTKAGGQSQQRFARRRDNQAREAYRAAADHAARILPTRCEALVTGGDREAVDEVLADPRLATAAAVRTSGFLPVAEPRRAVLDAAIADAMSVVVEVHNADR